MSEEYYAFTETLVKLYGVRWRPIFYEGDLPSMATVYKWPIEQEEDE